MNAPFSITRRNLLKSTGFVALSFAIPADLGFAQDTPELPGDLKNNPMLAAWFRIGADGKATLLIGKVELGQGAVTAMKQVGADELGVTWDQLDVISGDTAQCPNQGTTAGSQSMPNGAVAVRQAAAEIREILYGLAAAKLGQPAESMKVDGGTITAADGQTVTYWELVEGLDLEREATGKATFRPASEYKYIGQSITRLDIPAKMTGEPIFVQDMKPEGTLFGAVVRPPTYVAKLADVDVGAAESMSGVLAVVRNGSFLGIVAERWDQAQAAATALGSSAKWDVESVLPGTDGIYDWLQSKGEEKEIQNIERTAGGDPATVLEATYFRPYHMHGSIGTSAAIAQLDDSGVMNIWTHSQSVNSTRDAIAELLGVEPDKVRCIHTQGSGCYGHNMADDAAADAALLARAVPGKPVKLQYTRAQEHQWEPYGSAMVIKTKAGVGADGNILDWAVDIWSTPHGTRPSGKAGNLLSGRYVDPPFEQPVPQDGGPPNYAAARNSIAPYDFPGHWVATHFTPEMPLRVSSTRGLGAYANVFAIESFMDEVAAASGADPLEFRLRHLSDQRARDVLTAAGEKFGWAGYEKQENRGRGIAYARYKHSQAMTAIALEVEVTPRNGRVRVLRAVAANDSGHMISPDGIENQIEGGLIQGLSWTLKEEVKFDDTAVLSHDWASYPIITFSEVPPVEVVLIDRPGEPYLGTGEASQGPAGAALANAIFDAVGVRLRRVPFTPDRVKAAIDEKA
jgi:CO/xanthine dehydrogenase Mo-binding subunit